VRVGHAIAVAGGTGFIGRHVVERLLAAGHAVVVLARGHEPFEGAELRRCDLARSLAPELLAGCHTLINLVGIKRPTAAFDFEAAHVEIPRALADAAEAAGLERMIHVSVAGAERAEAGAGPYLESKRRGEQVLLERRGPLAITIVRPSVVYGRGDDMLRNLADSIRAAPLFPAPRGGRAELMPIAVEDVAEALLRCVERAATAGRCYDLVGPERLRLRALIERVAAAPSVARRCLVVPAPSFVQRPIAALLERLSDDPLITRAQLRLLETGVIGDPEPAQRELDFEPQALDVDAIERALASFEPRLPSVRLVPDPRAERALARLAGDSPSWATLLFAACAIGGLLLGPWLIEAIWLRMVVIDLVLLLGALMSLRLRWRELWRPTLPASIAGLSAGAIMWAGAFGVAALLAALLPSLWSGSAELYRWADALPLGLAIAMLIVIVAGEEIIWRGALGLGLAARAGPWAAVWLSAAAFTLAHVTIGSPLLLLAAVLAGAAWTYLAIRTRSLWAPFVAHMLWDVSLLWLTPLG
jgi:nucleoside-diphosphate-sugar epimerase/membrane protease YdiL (CAAX protease family)